jgi:hypothetical protein
MKQKIVYQIANSKTYNSQQEAERAEKDLLLSKIDGLIKSYFTDGHAKSSFQSLELIEKDLNLFKAKLQEILYILNFNGVNEDEQ